MTEKKTRDHSFRGRRKSRTLTLNHRFCKKQEALGNQNSKKIVTHSRPVAFRCPAIGVETQSMKNVELTEFGERVSALRRARGLSQQQLANKTGLHRTYISGVERGERNISLLNIHRIAAALGAVALLLTTVID
jgi:ribosome-binding protein aMBF1 (putative translation factor)